MADNRSLAAEWLDPETQARAALKFSRLASSNEAAATWAVAAAVFSLRDTVAEAMNAKAAVPAEPDRSQLTPEEIESIKRGPVGYMPVVEPVFRPAVTREQVAMAIASGITGGLCVGSRGTCLANSRCQCARQTDAVMKLLEGGE
jgi:hypothetical protein